WLYKRDVMKTVRSGFIVAILLELAAYSVLAQTFGFDGSAVIDCTCQINTVEKWQYASTVPVNKTMRVNLSEFCFRHREQVCKEVQKDASGNYPGFVGRVTLECPGKK